jgi:ABC-type Co2+ transport system permease subunit
MTGESRYKAIARGKCILLCIGILTRMACLYRAPKLEVISKLSLYHAFSKKVMSVEVPVVSLSLHTNMQSLLSIVLQCR